MPHFFTAPDFYRMAMDRRKQFDDQLDHFIESTMQMPARMKAAREAKAAADKRAAREEEYDSLLMQSMRQRLQPNEEVPAQQETQAQQAAQEAEAPAVQLTPEQQAAQQAYQAWQAKQQETNMQGYHPMARSR
ncbi:MAG: hypothetical protein LBH25_09580 [Fibromonadaceae bacterium]|jgi:hypothetical protein|nr:hypothetical protein [Fibromonadaceae bacterium]